MPTVVNLSTVHDYSLDKTMGAFLKICNDYSPNLPGFFAPSYNYAWLNIQFYRFYKSHIEPYKLGKITTEEFFNKLAEVLDFLPKDMDKNARNDLLEKAWNASITVSDKTEGRLAKLAATATNEHGVYLISNTNELNILAILSAFKKAYPALKFNEHIDVSTSPSQEPVEILPNVFLCLSYRYQMFKTDNLLAAVVKSTAQAPFTVVSQWGADREKAQSIGITDVYDDKTFFNTPPALIKTVY